MTVRTWNSGQNPQFDGFLFAPIGDDRNGARVSVLSALARLGVDPWQEAQKLAGLPNEFARERLDALIARLPGVPLVTFDHRAIAERLVALLPRPAGIGGRTRTTATGDDAVHTRSAAFIAFAVFLLLSQAMMLFHQPPSQGGGGGAPFSASAPPGK